MPDVFSVPIFFILFRETLEAAIIVSILFAFVRQVFHEDSEVRRRLMKQVWLGTGLGLAVSIALGVVFISVWYTVASNLWSASEELWEGCFGLLASLIVTLMGLAMLKTSRMQDKWRKKLTFAVGNGKDADGNVQQEVSRRFGKRYALFFIPFISVLREGVEAMVFLGGIAIGEPATSIPLAAVMGIMCGLLVGYLIYRGGNVLRLHWFFVGSTCFLLLIAAGLFSRAISNFESHNWKVYTGAIGAEEESSFDVRSNVWNLGCCDPHNNAGWSIFKAIFGWSNVASVGTVTGYCLYWIAVIGALVVMRMKDLRAAKKDREENGEKELEKTEEAFNDVKLAAA